MLNRNTYKEKILVVNSEASTRYLLESHLSIAGYQVVAAVNGQEALEVFHQEAPDLITMDVLLPGLDGYRICQELRKTSDVPIILLGALGDVANRIMGLESGADDYIVKPCSPGELTARIRAVLRRTRRETLSPSNPSIVYLGLLKIDRNRRQVYKGSQRIELTWIEFCLLDVLASNPSQTILRSEILQKVWGYTSGSYVDTRAIDVHISHLRTKLEDDPRNPKLILTEPGMGYLLSASSRNSIDKNDGNHN